MKDLWYHNAVIYALDVETFQDTDNDGVGDFQGLINRLNYLSGLGVTCLWLRPFYPSPLRDDGYDVMDYYTIDSRFGNMGDFVDFIKKAEALGIKVIIDLVINHTSNQHPWFQQARKDKNSKYRNYYVWSDEPDKEYKQKNILAEDGIWNYDKEAQAYYLHHFYKEQPDLNVSNPEVRKEIKKIMGFWLQLGVSGFRIDAAHILIKEVGSRKEGAKKVLHILEELRNFLKSRSHQAILLAEANVPVKELKDFFGQGSRMHLLFNFITNKHLFLSMARENPQPLIKALVKLKDIDGQWVNFMRHHDELNLEMLKKEERKEVFDAFAPDEDMRIFGHGIRRRLPPMLDNNRGCIELFYSVMFALPGIPLINYGEEIGMGDDLSQEGRNSVRTVMQWDDSLNAGFSKVKEMKLVHSVIKDGEFDHKKINVTKQINYTDSLLNWFSRLIITRKFCPQLGYGDWEVIKVKDDNILALKCVWQKEVVITFHNFSNKKIIFKTGFDDKKYENLTEIFSNKPYKNIKGLEGEVEITAHGYRWFKCMICI
jgi:maltose alpha-D-glucosyltransferase / alpha-amylase